MYIKDENMRDLPKCHLDRCDNEKPNAIRCDESAQKTHIAPKEDDDVVAKLRICNQRVSFDERGCEISVDNVACLTEHLQILKDNLLEISCKINELQELKRKKEIEECKNSTFVCCSLFIYSLLCLFCVLFGGPWLHYYF